MWHSLALQLFNNVEPSSRHHWSSTHRTPPSLEDEFDMKSHYSDQYYIYYTILSPPDMIVPTVIIPLSSFIIFPVTSNKQGFLCCPGTLLILYQPPLNLLQSQTYMRFPLAKLPTLVIKMWHSLSKISCHVPIVIPSPVYADPFRQAVKNGI